MTGFRPVKPEIEHHVRIFFFNSVNTGYESV